MLMIIYISGSFTLGLKNILNLNAKVIKRRCLQKKMLENTLENYYDHSMEILLILKSNEHKNKIIATTFFL